VAAFVQLLQWLRGDWRGVAAVLLLLPSRNRFAAMAKQ
jgi:hypothetical protein